MREEMSQNEKKRRIKNYRKIRFLNTEVDSRKIYLRLVPNFSDAEPLSRLLNKCGQLIAHTRKGNTALLTN